MGRESLGLWGPLGSCWCDQETQGVGNLPGQAASPGPPARTAGPMSPGLLPSQPAGAWNEAPAPAPQSRERWYQSRSHRRLILLAVWLAGSPRPLSFLLPAGPQAGGWTSQTRCTQVS